MLSQGAGCDVALPVPFIGTPLALDGWLEFNRWKWGLTPHKLRISPPKKSVPRIDIVLYTDRRGRIVVPPRNPHLPINLKTSDARQASRQYRQIVEVSELLANEMLQLGVRGTVGLDPEIQDVRPWIWKGFAVRPRYTFWLMFPFDPRTTDKALRKRARTARSRGFYVKTDAPIKDAYQCLLATEKRQGFSHRLSESDLKKARELLGGDSFRIYVAYSDDGVPVSTRIALHHPGTAAIGWVAGTKSQYLRHGVAQLVVMESLRDLSEAGASGFDYVGANIKNVAAAKADAGGRLITYYSVEQRSPKDIVRELLAASKSWWGRNS